LLGLAAGERMMMGLKLPDLISGQKSAFGGGPTLPGPVQYRDVALADGKTLACIRLGLLLIRRGDERFAVLVGGGRDYGWGQTLKIEIMSASHEASKGLLATLRKLMRLRNVFRGKIISLDVGEQRDLRVSFHNLRKVERSEIILPAGLLDRIERSAISFSTHAQKLLSGGRHLKRGILLHGPPGTGKTLTAMYLALRMQDRTCILITGRSQGLIEQAFEMARFLAPATVILEDVDLIAEERTHQNQACNAVLFELLNQLDGLADDSDVLVVLTTNRPDILEPALASRPGRIDMAVEIPLPDEECRARLIDLYATGLELVGVDRAALVERIRGASGAFIRELFRKAMLFSVEDEASQVRTEHLDEALHELVFAGGALTRSLLGAKTQA